MVCSMSKDDFDNRVKSILAQEFSAVIDVGLLSEETLMPVITRMRTSLHEAFAAMSVAEAEFHLQMLRDQCRETADSIVAMADSGYWN